MGLICLQGGRELLPGCEEMDATVLQHVDGPVVILAGAARVGADYDSASTRASEWYQRLRGEGQIAEGQIGEGQGRSVVVAPDPRTDRDGALRALAVVGLLVLPGGSPASLKQVLTGPVGTRVEELHREGTAISGASAGAMVLCQRMLLPSQGRRVVDGMGLVPGYALAHWGGPTRERPPADGLIRWGLPEQGGVLIEGGQALAVGQGTPSWLRAGRWDALPRDHTVAMP